MLHRHARPAVAGSYTGGAIAGALLSATVLIVLNGLLSPLPVAVRATVAVCAVALLLLRAVGLLCLDLPQRRVQIPRETFGMQPTRSAFRFAFELGTGVRTYITASAPYGLAAVVVLCLPADLGGAVLASAAAALGYGLGRSVVVATQALRRTIAVDHPAFWLRTADILSLCVALSIAARILTSA